MTVFCKKLTKKQKDAFIRFESISGFEPMYQDEIDSGVITPDEAFRDNIRWFDDVYADVMNINFPYEQDHQ